MAQNIKDKRLNSSHSQAQSLKAIMIDDLYDVLCAWVWGYVGIWLSIWLCVCTYDWVYDSLCICLSVWHTLCVCARACMHARECARMCDSAVVWLGVPGRSMTFWLPPPGRLPSSASVFFHAWWSNKINVVRPFGLGTHSPQRSVLCGEFWVNVHYSQQKSVPSCPMIAGHAQQGC